MKTEINKKRDKINSYKIFFGQIMNYKYLARIVESISNKLILIVVPILDPIIPIQLILDLKMPKLGQKYYASAKKRQ